jgi:hypothetical protein
MCNVSAFSVLSLTAPQRIDSADNKHSTVTEPGNRYQHHIHSTSTTSHSVNKYQITIMPPPSKVAIATGSVLRLVKEEASYHKEIAQQEERIKKLEASEGDENKEYTLKQEVGILLY